ncbi:hypothetical protein BR93DRAFT_920569 [Coniochaeta sp. PMI_546]|nr:hypothetical protein BR93DRAFT_920569 [Coniochaeta sp. PMI_546]
MGTFTFKWPHAAEEVYVTGTFDNWSKSEKLEKVGDHFEKTVTLPETGDSIFYKFVVDGNWVTDHTAPIAKDPEGNDNNLLKVENITKEAPPMAAVLNTVSPESTTAALAGQVPLEPKHDSHAAEKKDTPAEEKNVAATGLPGSFPETPAGDLDKQFSVNPLPATDFAVNPVKLEAGEKVPQDIASNGIHDHVTLDKESYEKSDRIPGLTGLTAPTDLAPTSIGTIIPESSLPISSGDVLTNSAAPQSSTAALAANVPLESQKAPEVVKQSQVKADEEVGSSGMEKLAGEKLEDKAEVENELLSKVPEAPATAEGTSGKGTEKSENTKSAVEHIAEGAGVAGVALVAAGLAAKDASTKAAATNVAAQLPEPVKNVLPASVQAAIPTPETKEELIEKISPEVPVEVKESIVESGQGPEATVNTAAVEQKSAVESELLKEVETTKPIDEQPKPAGNVPEEVKESIAEAGKAPEAASSSDAPPAEAVDTPAKSEAPSTPAKTAAAAPSSTTPGGSSKGAGADSPATAERKKKNRLSSFFGKIKEKVAHKDKP